MRTPDFNNLLKVLDRKRPDRPTLFEFFMNGPLYRYLADMEEDPEDELGYAKVEIQGFCRAGYDYAISNGLREGTLVFPKGKRESKSSTSLNHGGLIVDRASFDAYPWPDIDDFDYSRYEKIRPFIPEGMKLIGHGPGGVLENAVSLIGYEAMCFMTVEDEDLLQDIFDAIGQRLLAHYERCLSFDTIGAVVGNDDWGFNTQTMLPPEALKKYVFPWHKKIVEAAHKAGRPAILHSCGNLEKVMDIIIDDIQYDGKHSYEDKIQPVEEAYEQYGQRIAIMGGIDVDFVCRKTPEEVFQRSKNMLDRSREKGSYALGSGNSIPEYVPDEKYLAMISAAVPWKSPCPVS